MPLKHAQSNPDQDNTLTMGEDALHFPHHSTVSHVMSAYILVTYMHTIAKTFMEVMFCLYIKNDLNFSYFKNGV